MTSPSRKQHNQCGGIRKNSYSRPRRSSSLDCSGAKKTKVPFIPYEILDRIVDYIDISEYYSLTHVSVTFRGLVYKRLPKKPPRNCLPGPLLLHIMNNQQASDIHPEPHRPEDEARPPSGYTWEKCYPSLYIYESPQLEMLDWPDFKSSGNFDIDEIRRWRRQHKVDETERDRRRRLARTKEEWKKIRLPERIQGQYSPNTLIDTKELEEELRKKEDPYAYKIGPNYESDPQYAPL